MRLISSNRKVASDLRIDRITPAELEYMAFAGEHELVHGLYRSIPAEDRVHFANKSILSEVVSGGIHKLRKFLAASEENDAQAEKEFIDETVRFFIATCDDEGTLPRELLTTMVAWGDELVKLSLLREALGYYNEALQLGAGRYPDLHVGTLRRKAELLRKRGQMHTAYGILSSLAERPYLVHDRRALPEILLALAKVSLQMGNTVYYKSLLFRGLRQFSGSLEDRRVFVDQVRSTYRRTLSLLLNREVTFINKVLYALHWMHFRIADQRILRRLRLGRISRLAVLAFVYLLNYLRPDAVFARTGGIGSGAGAKHRTNGRRFTGSGATVRRNVLVTRAMGGIGDLLMMTPGFHALKERYPHEEIHLAVPRRYFPVFEGNPDVTLLDIETEEINYQEYRKWFNLTDCPAARVESRTAPKVRRSRIDIFAGALGIGPFRRSRMSRTPRYTVSDDERFFQQQFWLEQGLEGKTVLAVQLRADETYRSFPHIEELVRVLAAECAVLVFDSETIHGLDIPNVIKVDRFPLRLAFALVQACDAVVAPDSAFVHLAAAFGQPCVALYGPIDAKVRTGHYPSCRFVDVRTDLRCVPCWRNEMIPCKLTGMRGSVCMATITVAQVKQTLDALLAERRCS